MTHPMLSRFKTLSVHDVWLKMQYMNLLPANRHFYLVFEPHPGVANMMLVTSMVPLVLSGPEERYTLTAGAMGQTYVVDGSLELYYAPED